MVARVPLLLVPGLLCDAALWSHQIEHLADIADMRVADITGADSLAGMAEAALAVAPPRFAVAGLSMGGYTAQEIMRRAPDRVIKLALLDTSARADNEEQAARRRSFMEQTKIGDFKGVTSRLLQLLVHPGRLADTPLTDEIVEMAVRVGRDAFLRGQTALLSRPDGRRDLAKINCPTLVLCGRQDLVTPLDWHEELAAAIPQSKLVVIEECGHLSTMERPHAVTAVLRYWLQG